MTGADMIWRNPSFPIADSIRREISRSKPNLKNFAAVHRANLLGLGHDKFSIPILFYDKIALYQTMMLSIMVAQHV